MNIYLTPFSDSILHRKRVIPIAIYRSKYWFSFWRKNRKKGWHIRSEPNNYHHISITNSRAGNWGRLPRLRHTSYVAKRVGNRWESDLLALARTCFFRVNSTRTAHKCEHMARRLACFTANLCGEEHCVTTQRTAVEQPSSRRRAGVLLGVRLPKMSRATAYYCDWTAW